MSSIPDIEQKSLISHEREATPDSLKQKAAEPRARPKRPRRGSAMRFANPRMSYAETKDRLASLIGTRDPDFLSHLISQVVAAGELGAPSDDLEVNFLFSLIEDVLANGGAAKAMLAAQYGAVHVQIMNLARRLNRVHDPALLDTSLARTSVAQYEALTRGYAGVTVGQVSVSEGGQAIVGNITHNQREPATEKVASPQLLLTDAKPVPMSILEESKERDAVPVAPTESEKRKK